MSFEDIGVPVTVKVDSAELKQLIKDFDGSAEAGKRLQDATESVKNSFSAQAGAIRAVNQINRVNNFQMIETLRLVRSATSLFSNLNSVYQTLILRQIANTQTTVAQREAFEKVAGSVPDIVNALAIFGSKNQEVQDGLDGLNTSLQNMSSESIQKLIDQWKGAEAGANLSGDALAAYNKELKTMQDILAEVKLKEKQKEFQEFFGNFINIAQTATGLGTFAIALNATATGAKALNLALASSPYILAFLAGIEVLNDFGIIDTPSPSSILTGETAQERRNRKGITPEMVAAQNAKFGETVINNYFNIPSMTLNHDADIEKFAGILTEKQKLEFSKKDVGVS